MVGEKRCPIVDTWWQVRCMLRMCRIDAVTFDAALKEFVEMVRSLAAAMTKEWACKCLVQQLLLASSTLQLHTISRQPSHAALTSRSLKYLLSITCLRA